MSPFHRVTGKGKKSCVYAGIATLLLAMGLVTAAHSDTITVTTTGDAVPTPPVGSLRWAIEEANTLTGGPHTIEFSVSGTIDLAAALPPLLVDGTEIRGETAPGNCNPGDPPNITLNGQYLWAYGLSIQADDCRIRGLGIEHCDDGIEVVDGSGNEIGLPGPGGCERIFLAENSNGLVLTGAGSQQNLVRNCEIFLNEGYGILVLDGCSENTIGGTVDEERNYVYQNNNGVLLASTAGPVTSNLVIGNYVFNQSYSGIILSGEQHELKYNHLEQNHVGVMPGGFPGGNGYTGVILQGANCTRNRLGPDNVIMHNDSTGVVIWMGANQDTVTTNTVSRNTRSGILVLGEDTIDNAITINYIGTNADGDLLGNCPHGIVLSQNSVNTRINWNEIGDQTEYGIVIGCGAHHNRVVHNYIGTDATETLDLGNTGGGILLAASNNIIGRPEMGGGNVICFNEGWGIQGSAAVKCSSNTIIGNLIGTNSRDEMMGNDSGGIWLGAGLIDNDLGDQPAENSGNVIKYNSVIGLKVGELDAAMVPVQNRFLTNQICDNVPHDCALVYGGNDELPAPMVNSAMNAISISSGELVGIVSGRIGFAYPPPLNSKIQVFYDSEDTCGVFFGETAVIAPDETWTVVADPLPTTAYVYATETTRWPGRPTRQTSCESDEEPLSWLFDWNIFCGGVSCPWGGEDLAGRTASWVDFDIDGHLDLFICYADGSNVLLRNDGEGFFSLADIGTLGAEQHVSFSAAWADFDNDGDPDVYLVNADGPNQLFRNDGGESFVDITPQVLADAGPGRTASWIDYDGDVDLDLFLTNHGASDRLYRNDGGGSFTDKTDILYEVGWETLPSVGAAWADYDQDGDPDLYIVNGDGPNMLFENLGGEDFEDVTSGPLGDPGQGRGVVWGDFWNSGHLGLYIANYDGPNKLLRNLGDGTFEDATFGAAGDPGAGRGVGAGDFDLDGDLDLFVVNDGTPSVVLRNTGSGVFILEDFPWPEPEIGPGLSGPLGDFHGDGAVDWVIILDDRTRENILLGNLQADGHHWLQVELNGAAQNREGIGARIEVVTGRGTQVREVSAGTGALGQSSTLEDFGLGDADHAAMVRVYFPDVPTPVEITNVAADQRIVVSHPGGMAVEPGREVLTPATRILGASPNPFHTATRVYFQMRSPGRAGLHVYDPAGRLVETLADRHYGAGLHEVTWRTPAGSQPSGVYFLRLVTAGQTHYQRVLCLQ